MTFNIVRALIAVLLVSHTSCNFLEPVTYTRDEIYGNQVPSLKSWDDTVETILEGKGSLIGRTSAVKKELDKSRAGIKNAEDSKEALKHFLEWDSVEPIPQMTLWDEGAARFTKIKENKFPYDLPTGVRHFIYWFRPSFIPRDAFNGLDQNTANVYLDYIQHFDFCGSYGISTNINGIYRLGLAHPTDLHVWSKNGVQVTRENGIWAMDHVGHKINTLLQEHFPETKYEVVWNQSPNRIKSVMQPNHFHVFVKRKG